MTYKLLQFKYNVIYLTRFKYKVMQPFKNKLQGTTKKGLYQQHYLELKDYIMFFNMMMDN